MADTELPPQPHDEVPPIGDLLAPPGTVEQPAGAVATGPQAPVNPAVQTAALSTTLNARLAPQDLEAERSVLGGILLTNESFFDVVRDVKPEDFYREPHRQIFSAMQSLAERTEPIDVITLADELKRKGELESAGGPVYLASLDASVPATANLSRYARIVRDKALARRLITAAHTIAREGYDQVGSVEALVESAESKVYAAAEALRTGARSEGLVKFSPIVKKRFQHMEDLYENQADITGLATGFTSLDWMTTGLQPAEFVIVAGRPSMGKTSLVMNMAAHVAIEQKITVAVFSLEMSKEALTDRMFSSEARVDGQRIRTGKFIDSDWPKLARAADRLFKAPLYIDDAGGQTVLDLRAKCRRLKAKCPDLGLVIVDYLQLMEGAGDEDSEEQALSGISRGLKELAKDLKCPVIALSQLNRTLEKRTDKRPILSDLRGSGAIEQDADTVIGVYRDEVYDKESRDKGVAELIMLKQRNGPTGTVRVAFLRDYTRFENLAPEQSSIGDGR